MSTMQILRKAKGVYQVYDPDATSTTVDEHGDKVVVTGKFVRNSRENIALAAPSYVNTVGRDGKPVSKANILSQVRFGEDGVAID